MLKRLDSLLITGGKEVIVSDQRTTDGVLLYVRAFCQAKTHVKPREIIRAKVPAPLFFIFNVTFISFIQSILLFALAAPTYIVLLTSNFEQEITAADIGFAAIQLGLVVSEWFSDQQQWGTSL